MGETDASSGGGIDPWPQETAAADNDFDPVMVFDEDRQAGSRHAFGFVHWRLVRSGEIIVWGVGRIVVDLPFDEGYELHVGPRVDSFDEHDWTLETADGERVGWASGRVHHKMVREFSPDIRAYIGDFTDHQVCPECGLQFSTSEPEETFDGLTDGYIRACEHEGRVFSHSEGDVRGYPPEQ